MKLASVKILLSTIPTWLFLLAACDSPVGNQSVQNPLDTLSTIEKYLAENFHGDSFDSMRYAHESEKMPLTEFIVQDSVEINGLNCTRYVVARPNVIDGNSYVIIRDHGNGRFYKLVIPSWPLENDWVSPEIQVDILKHSNNIELVHNQYLELEEFLNHSAMVQKRGITMAQFDSLLSGGRHSIMTEDSTDKVLRNQCETFTVAHKKWQYEISSLLKSKLCQANVLLIGLPPMVLYFELNPTMQKIYSRDTSERNIMFDRYYIKHDTYNISYLRLDWPCEE
jgi:hypothetical protein